MGGEPVLDGSNHEVLVLCLLFGKFEQGGQLEEAGDNGVASVGVDPQDAMVIVAVAMGVFHGGLRFADAAQSADGLRLCEDGGFAGGEIGV
jgi:hypothetical protein